MCHTVLGLSRGEQNLLLCETAQVAKSCLPPPRHESPGSGRGWSPAHSGTGTSCPGSHSSLSWRKPSVGSRARSACAKELPHPCSRGLLTHNGDRHQNQAVPPLLPVLCGSQSLFQCPFLLFCLIQSLCTEAVSIHSQEEKAELRQTWLLSVGSIYPSSAQ